jgi:phosphate transport system substrate-binding protein
MKGEIVLTGKNLTIRRIVGMVAAAAFLVTLSVSGIAGAQDATPIPYEPGAELASLSGTVVSDGSSTVGPMTEAVAEEFGIMIGEVGGNVQVEVSISGTGGGFERFCAGETDLQNASRAISEDEVGLCTDGGVDYYEFEVAYDGMAVVVNPENDFVECLTVEQLNQMWRPEDTATMWNEVDPSFPEEPIVLYGPGTDSGTFDYFTDVINGEEGVSTTNYSPSEDDNQLVLGVAGDENALGYFGLAYYENNADQLKLVAVDDGDGCVTPSAETVGDGTYTPLSRPLYVYVNAESLTRPEIQEFVRFYLANASFLAADVGYVSSPAGTYLEDQAKLESAIAGEAAPDGPGEAAG